jgi:hypothetical protein
MTPHSLPVLNFRNHESLDKSLMMMNGNLKAADKSLFLIGQSPLAHQDYVQDVAVDNSLAMLFDPTSGDMEPHSESCR